MSQAPSPFSADVFAFLTDLEKNNRKDWFDDNKGRYEAHVRDASFDFISQVGPGLREISPHFMAIPKIVGGSLFRIYRDVRFSKDKRPYKDHVGIHFRHRRSKDVHAPGFYLHLAPGGCFTGLGIWHPDAKTLGAIRQAVDQHGPAWDAACGGSFGKTFGLAGDSLARAPKGYDPDHPRIEDLKRKDFIGSLDLAEDDVLAPGFVDRFVGLCADGTEFMRFLCSAIDVEF